MTDPANDAAAQPIGDTTDQRIRLAFSDTALLTAKATAQLLGLDEGTLRDMAERGYIRCVRRGTGSVRAYREGDIRLFLTQGPAPEPEPVAPKVSRSGTTRVVSFMDRRRAKRQA